MSAPKTPDLQQWTETAAKELKDRRYHRKPSLRKKLKREEAARQRVKDTKKELKAAQREQDNWMN